MKRRADVELGVPTVTGGEGHQLRLGRERVGVLRCQGVEWLEVDHVAVLVLLLSAGAADLVADRALLLDGERGGGGAAGRWFDPAVRLPFGQLLFLKLALLRRHRDRRHGDLDSVGGGAGTAA